MPNISHESIDRLRELCAAAEVLIGCINDDDHILRALHDVKEDCREALGPEGDPYTIVVDHSYEEDKPGRVWTSNKASRQAFINRVSDRAAKSKIAAIKSIIAESESKSTQIEPEARTTKHLERIEGVLASKRKTASAGLEINGASAKKAK